MLTKNCIYCEIEKMGLGSGGCDPRIEAIVKLKSRGSDWVGFGWM